MEGYVGYGDLKKPSRRKMQLADQLMQQGMSTQPLGHWTQGAAQLAQALIGRRMANKYETEQESYERNRSKALENALGNPDQDLAAALMSVSGEDRGLVGDVFGQRQEQQRYDAEMGYRDRRDAVSDDQWQQGMDFRVDRADVADNQWQQGHDFRLDRADVADNQWQQGHDFRLDRADVADNQWQQGMDFRVDRAAVQDQQWQQGFDRGVFESDRGFDYTVGRDGVADNQWQQTYNLKKQEMANDMAGDSNAGVAPGLAGLPSGVQGRIVGEEFGILSEAEEAADAARNAAGISRRFMDDAKGYGALGGGILADVGQIFSNKTARLKGHTAQMIPLMRTAGEGVMTDADARRYEDAVNSVNKGRKANQSVTDVFTAAEQEAEAYEGFLRSWQATHGYGSLQQGQQLWDQYRRANPVYDPDTGQPVKGRLSIQSWVDQMEGRGQPQVPSGAIAMLRSDPSLAEEFDAKYGAGAAAQILNGK